MDSKWNVQVNGKVVINGLSYREANDYAIDRGLYNAQIGLD